MENNKKDSALVRSSAAEYLTFVASTGEDKDSIEMRYEDENIWLTQKMMATLYDVSVAAINQHLKKIFEDGELQECTMGNGVREQEKAARGEADFGSSRW